MTTAGNGGGVEGPAAGNGGTAGLSVEGLSVAYRTGRGAATAVDGVSFHVAPGETYGIVGESGCGKTTLSRALGRHLPRNGAVTGGRVRVDGVEVLDLAPADLRSWRAASLAVVHQDAGGSLDPTMRVGAQLAEIFRLRGLSRAAARAEVPRLLARVRLPDPVSIARRYPHQLSGGQQQRVVIAAALTARPRLLVLDEPTTGLDATVEREILDLIWGLRSEIGAAVVLISHDLGLVGRLCDRVGVLYAGRMAEEGPARDVLTRPRHPYTAALLAAVPRLGESRHARALTAIPGHPPVPGEQVTGCPFAPRCAFADDLCAESAPLPEAAGAEHEVRCHHVDRLPDRPVPVDVAAPSRTGPGTPVDVAAPSLAEAGTPVDVAAPSLAEAGTPPGEAVPGGPLLEVRGLTRRYGRTTVVDDVDLTIGHGEVLGLVGESGSGKTTLARAVTGLGTRGPGTIRLDGQVLPAGVGRRDARARRRVQMVFQSPDASLNPSHTVRAILARALRSLRGSSSPQELGARAGLAAHLLDSRPGRLSGGQKQRVAIARAFAGDPGLVVCDEPVSALDVSVQAGVLRLLADRQRTSGTSYLFISHDLAVVGYLADRVAVMYRGQIVEEGPAGQVLHGPHHPYTASLVAASLARLGEPGGDPGTVPPGRSGATGCRFAARCPQRIDGLCDTEDPPVRTEGSGHTIRCHLGTGDLPRGTPGAATGAAPDPAKQKEDSPA
ncbi:dipeptide ABC transporter ATP-binding protein [Sphaerisporangium corydalis]|uniref:Dipeptide ABC transporter ATP-binding protein n=1 Tax=Sphaerisporangium corydalis TaxID=1441875 RepID=A0ABV9EHV1_9ACTN|nr:ABC transporter ATP-binding protein [Sphaerisporangium corydalis]